MSTALDVANPHTPATREQCILRCLRVVGATYGRITPTQLGQRQGWTTRTAASYLRVLNEAGYAEPVNVQPGRESRWRITAAGKLHLQDVTIGLYGSKFEAHPASRKDQ